MSEPVGFADDDARVFAQGGIEQFALEQLRGTAQAAQGVFDFVRELADHEPAPPELRQQGIFSGQAPVLSDVLDFQQQAAAFLTEGGGGHRAIEDAVEAAGRRPGQFAQHHALAALPGALE